MADDFATLEVSQNGEVTVISFGGREVLDQVNIAACRDQITDIVNRHQTKTLAFEWGPKVRVNCVAPGAFRTDGWEATYDAEVGSDMSGVPLPYPGRPADIAKLQKASFEKFPAITVINLADVLDRAYSLEEPHHLCDYGFNLSQAFNAFYKECHILREADPKRQASWLALCQATHDQLVLMLGLLGIEIPQRM